MKLFIALLLIFSANLTQMDFAHARLERGGHDVGEQQEEEELRMPWWVGNKTVSYCIVTSPKFGLAKTDAEKVFESALATWKKYLDEKKPDYDGEPLARNFQRVSKCSKKTDLTVYLGYVNKEVKENRPDPIPESFNFKRSRSDDGIWTKGFLWIARAGTVIPEIGAPNWSKPNLLEAAIEKALAPLIKGEPEEQMQEGGHDVGDGAE